MKEKSREWNPRRSNISPVGDSEGESEKNGEDKLKDILRKKIARIEKSLKGHTEVQGRCQERDHVYSH